MSYKDCKQALFNSSAIGNIPDNWYKSMPILFALDNISYVGFLFWKSTDKNISLKEIIAVNTVNYKIQVYSIDQISDLFGLTNFIMNTLQIEDPKLYFAIEKEYEEVLESIVDMRTSDYSYLSILAKKIYSEDQYKMVLQKIGNSFYF